MNLTDEQKKELKNLVITDCVSFLPDIDNANNDLNETAKVVEEKYNIKKADFKKMCKIYYKASLEEEKAKAQDIFTLYEEVLE